MPDSLQASIYEALAEIRLVDPHTHIDPHAPAARTLADLLGYHYYTELAHSAGMPRGEIEDESLGPKQLVERLVRGIEPIENTAQYRWLVEICQRFFGLQDDRLDTSNWEAVYDEAEKKMSGAEWPQAVLEQSGVDAVFLTNDFDDPLSGFDTGTYIPCLRTDDLVFHLAKPETRQRLAACSGIELDGSLTRLRDALRQRFEHFVAAGARACAISLPPEFSPTPVSDGRAGTALDAVLRQGTQAAPGHLAALARRVFWTITELCDEFSLPFDLMIGVVRGVYPGGVHQGRDLYDSRVSLIQYRELFNAFPEVKFPISVLASVTNQELTSYAWIFPNVITNGHWWYSNTPSFIARDAAARLEAVPRTKQIAYYSDAYKLEFVWPKFDMYRQVLAGILAEQFVGGAGWSEERAIALGRQVLRDNVDQVFPLPPEPPQRPAEDSGVPIARDTQGESHELDLAPGDEEIEALGIPDVEIADSPAARAASQAQAGGAESAGEPLDVGDLFGDGGAADDSQSAANQIRMLRGEASFVPSDDSFQLQPDPTTGELRWQHGEGGGEQPGPTGSDEDAEEELRLSGEQLPERPKYEKDQPLLPEDDEADQR